MKWNKVTITVSKTSDVYAKARLFAELVGVRTNQVEIYINHEDLYPSIEGKFIMMGGMLIEGYDPNDQTLIVEAYDMSMQGKKNIGVTFGGAHDNDISVELIYDPHSLLERID